MCFMYLIDYTVLYYSNTKLKHKIDTIDYSFTLII